MTPELLAFEAFGPYVKKQEIDFRRLERAGLFLIHGKTGAGKTTVLDAMTYALFGESSGGARGEIAAMRSDFAGDEQDTSVDFIFRINENRYRFTRKVRVRVRKNGEKELQPSQNAFFMNENGEYEPFFENPGVRNVRQKAEELLGLTYEQFRQVVLLPQGKFEQLLVADSAAKEEILVTLFKAERWQEITDWLCAKALELKRAKEGEAQGLATILSQYECESAEDLRALLAQKKEEQREREKAFVQMEKEADAANKALQNAKTMAGLFAEWEQAKKKAAEAERQQPEMEALERRCARAAAAAQLLPLRREAETLQKQWKERGEKGKKINAEMERLWEDHALCLRTLAGILGEIEKEKSAKREKLSALQEAVLGKERDYQEIFSAYMKDAAHLLADNLSEGEPCPVCGSVHHPAVASGRGSGLSAQDLEKAGQETKELREQISSMEQELFVVAREADECKEALERFHWDGRMEATERTDKKQIKSLIAAGERLLAERKTAEASAGGLMEEEEQAKKDFEQALEGFRTACEEKGFHTDEEFRAACMTDADIEKARAGLREYDIQKNIAAETVKSCAEKLEGTEPADMAPLQEAYDMRAAEKKKAEAALAENKAVLDLLEKACANVEKREKELRKKTKEYVELDSFSKLLRGSNGVSLQRYVLGVMLTAITQEANVLLKKVHDGRYQLYRALEGAGRSRKAGLDLEVFDSYSGERRSVNSLSGGEKFLVALALSLGLSTVVQAQSGGIRIDAMFIDEGFGSLDPASIENALDILAGVRGASKLIGIISHVQALKENIETTIEVRKERTGSDLIINC